MSNHNNKIVSSNEKNIKIWNGFTYDELQTLKYNEQIIRILIDN